MYEPVHSGNNARQSHGRDVYTKLDAYCTSTGVSYTRIKCLAARNCAQNTSQQMPNASKQITVSTSIAMPACTEATAWWLHTHVALGIRWCSMTSNTSHGKASPASGPSGLGSNCQCACGQKVASACCWQLLLHGETSCIAVRAHQSLLGRHVCLLSRRAPMLCCTNTGCKVLSSSTPTRTV